MGVVTRSLSLCHVAKPWDTSFPPVCSYRPHFSKPREDDAARAGSARGEPHALFLLQFSSPPLSGSSFTFSSHSPYPAPVCDDGPTVWGGSPEGVGRSLHWALNEAEVERHLGPRLLAPQAWALRKEPDTFNWTKRRDDSFRVLEERALLQWNPTLSPFPLPLQAQGAPENLSPHYHLLVAKVSWTRREEHL